ncbi:rho guanine nucleotide exchange factor 33 isoform X1 [Polypterus senegalus]|uniref:rho guanine nucleotide exchange factor 33 isoform X1 n=1 Tax=Polypterus senegalus TaxID=55291 RepID=UPI0019666355|nr:rho guanine nucleotide exchange factor 33 isoform X1 [Polypterus senegalus]
MAEMKEMAGRSCPGTDALKTCDTELAGQISQLHMMVAELKAGFGDAVVQLSSIQHYDSVLQQRIDQTRWDYSQEIQQLRDLVYGLKDDLGDAMRHIGLVSDLQKRLQQDLEIIKQDRVRAPAVTEHQSCSREPFSGNLLELNPSSGNRPTCSFLNALIPGHRQSQGALPSNQNTCLYSLDTTGTSPHFPAPFHIQGSRQNIERPFSTCGIKKLPGCTSGSRTDQQLEWFVNEGGRSQAVLELLYSEQKYVSCLSELQVTFIKALEALPQSHEVSDVFLACLYQLSQHHKLLRNTLESRIFSHRWQGIVGDTLAQLTNRDDGNFLDIYLTYFRIFPSFHSLFCLSRDQNYGSFTQCKQKQLESLMSAPLSRISSYLSHVQNISRWTHNEHPDHYFLGLSEKRLQEFLRCSHIFLKEANSQFNQRLTEGSHASLESASPSPPSHSSLDISHSLSSCTTRDSGVVCEDGGSRAISEVISRLEKLTHDPMHHAEKLTKWPSDPYSLGNEQKFSSLNDNNKELKAIRDPETVPYEDYSTSHHSKKKFNHGPLRKVSQADQDGESVLNRSEKMSLMNWETNCDTDIDGDDLCEVSVFDYHSVSSSESSSEMTNVRKHGPTKLEEKSGILGEGDATDEEAPPVLIKPTPRRIKYPLGRSSQRPGTLPPCGVVTDRRKCNTGTPHRLETAQCQTEGLTPEPSQEKHLGTTISSAFPDIVALTSNCCSPWEEKQDSAAACGYNGQVRLKDPKWAQHGEKDMIKISANCRSVSEFKLVNIQSRALEDRSLKIKHENLKLQIKNSQIECDDASDPCSTV